jgi:type IV pilus assembly protein PilW
MTAAHHAERARGFSLVELMLAVAISLIATIVMFEVFAASEGVKRTAVGVGDAQQNGSLALYTVNRDARIAGYGINNPALLGCTVRAYDATKTPPDIPSFVLAPLVITPGATPDEPDMVALMYSESDLVSYAAKFIAPQTAADAEYKVDSRFGFQPGDVVIAAESGKDCAMGEVTEVPGTPGRTDELIHNSGSYINNDGVRTDARFNKAGGLGVAYTTSGRLFNLGQLPTHHTFRIENGSLVLEDMFGAPESLVVVDNVVQLKAQYGRDDGIDNGTVDNAVYAAGDGIVDNYTSSMPAVPAAADWARNLAVRLAVVSRSVQPERPNVAGGDCDATTAFPTWSGGALDLSANPDWRCYRYKVFETTIPLRNMLWTQP